MTGLRPFLADETGTSTIEFVFCFPIVMLIFLASFESGYFMIRHVMLERSVDIVVRDIRLGLLSDLETKTDPAKKLKPEEFRHRELKKLICGTSLLGDVATCVGDMKIWLQAINTATFDMKAPECTDRDETIVVNQARTDKEFKFGTDNDIMLMRICLKAEPMFPTSIIGASLIANGEGDGGYALLTTTVFVNEPG